MTATKDQDSGGQEQGGPYLASSRGEAWANHDGLLTPDQIVIRRGLAITPLEAEPTRP